VQLNALHAHIQGGIYLQTGAGVTPIPVSYHSFRKLLMLTSVDRWLYALILTIDANFRLKNKERNLAHDVSLGDGWAFWVESTPYQEYVDIYGHQEEVCAVLFQFYLDLHHCSA
jgi:hypothetical protein